MLSKKKSAEGFVERLALLRKKFPRIDVHVVNRPPGVAKDDLLDARLRRGLRFGFTRAKHVGSASRSVTRRVSQQRFGISIEPASDSRNDYAI